MKHYKRVIPFVTLLVICLVLLSVIFFPNLVNFVNYGEYDEISVKVVESGYDGFLSLIPRIKTKYKYNGVSYEENTILYNSFFFNEKIGDKCHLFINKKAPKYSIYLFNPINSNYITYPIYILFLICCFFIIVNSFLNIRFFFIQRKQKKIDKELKIKEKEKKKSKKLQKYLVKKKV